MAARYSASGKRIGRPPKEKAPVATEQEAAVGRAVVKFLNRYDAAGRGRRTAGWNAPSTGPNEAINGGLQTLRDRTSDSIRNDWSGESVVQKWTTTLIGIAITPRFRRIKSKTRRQEVNDLWADFVKQADADWVLDLYGMQTLATRSWLERGEVFARRRYRRTDDGLRVPMQVQLLEADMVPVFDADTFDSLPSRNRIRSGIEFDNRGKRVAYWVYKDHPGDKIGSGGSIPSRDALVRVVAEDMAHMYEPKRVGQLRGVPILAPVLTRLRGINDYEDVTLERQKIANLFVAFISRTLPPVDPTDPNADALSGLVGELDDGGSPLLPMKPGLLQELDDGQDVKFANPPDPATNYSEYMRTSHLGTAAGSGLPYELFSGDILGVSDRTLRVMVNELRRFASQRQWQIIIPQLCQKIIEWFADSAAVVGELTLEERDAVIRCEHAPHGWDYLHPVQDVQGKALEVQNGFRSRSSVIGEQGDDPDMVDDERAEDLKREKDLGLPNPNAPEPAQGDQQDGDGIDDSEYSAPPNPAGDGVRAKLDDIERMVASLQTEYDKVVNRQPAPVVPNITANITVPATVVNNEVNPTPVNIDVQNSVQPTPVNVAAPNVNVTSPTVNVEAPHVNVSPVLKQSDRVTVTTVNRDEQGNIINTTQVSKDADQE